MIQKSLSLKYEPSSEPLHISVKRISDDGWQWKLQFVVFLKGCEWLILTTGTMLNTSANELLLGTKLCWCTSTYSSQSYAEVDEFVRKSQRVNLRIGCQLKGVPAEQWKGWWKVRGARGAEDGLVNLLRAEAAHGPPVHLPFRELRTTTFARKRDLQQVEKRPEDPRVLCVYIFLYI